MLTMNRCPGGNDAQARPRIGTRVSTLINTPHQHRNSAPELREHGFRITGFWLPNGGAQCLLVGEVRTAGTRLSEGRLALWYVRGRGRFHAELAPLHC